MKIQNTTTKVNSNFTTLQEPKNSTKETKHTSITSWQYLENMCSKTHGLFNNIVIKPNEHPSTEPAIKKARINIIAESTSMNPKIKPSEISSSTEECLERLNRPTTDHLTAIHYWIWQIYQKHGYNLHYSGGHMMDYLAQERADQLLNDYLLNEILKLTPYSEVASNLRAHAIKTTQPLSAPFKGKNVNLNKLKI